MLLHCEVARAILVDFFSRVRKWVIRRKVLDLLDNWRGFYGIPKIMAIWKMVSISEAILERKERPEL